jgi:hypothetical protein
MKQEQITKIVNKVYPLIIQDVLSCDFAGTYPEIEFHYNIYERLSGEKGMTGEVCAHAEYDWVMCKIYIYTSRMFTEEDIIRSLIHECVHANQSKVKFDAYYLCGETYDTHPYEIEARNAEEKWEKYKINK